MKARRIAVLATGLAFVAGGLLSGCGSSDDATFAAKISPEMEAKKAEMFKDYGKQAAERGRAARQQKKR